MVLHLNSFCSFEEIVPLNAGNVLGVEDNGPTTKWLAFIRHRSNININQSSSFTPFSSDGPTASPEQLYSFDSGIVGSQLHENSAPYKRNSSQVSFGSDSSEDEGAFSGRESPYTILCNSVSYSPSSDRSSSNSSEMNYRFNSSEPNYCLVASKQMVGVFLCVWMRSHLRQHARDIKISCIGCGLMGYLGNKVRKEKWLHCYHSILLKVHLINRVSCIEIKLFTSLSSILRELLL